MDPEENSATIVDTEPPQLERQLEQTNSYNTPDTQNSQEQSQPCTSASSARREQSTSISSRSKPQSFKNAYDVRTSKDLIITKMKEKLEKVYEYGRAKNSTAAISTLIHGKVVSRPAFVLGHPFARPAMATNLTYTSEDTLPRSPGDEASDHQKPSEKHSKRRSESHGHKKQQERPQEKKPTGATEQLAIDPEVSGFEQEELETEFQMVKEEAIGGLGVNVKQEVEEEEWEGLYEDWEDEVGEEDEDEQIFSPNTNQRAAHTPSSSSNGTSSKNGKATSWQTAAYLDESDPLNAKLPPGMSINTKELCGHIAAELKQHNIQQTVFAERILCRRQGTLSDLLRNPKSWESLKAGRETFLRMYNWFNMPLATRLSIVDGKKSANKRKRGSDAGTPSTSSRPSKRLKFTKVQKTALHALFRKTQRPSRDLQEKMSRQLNLDLSTVQNFFMNARRRSRNAELDI